MIIRFTCFVLLISIAVLLSSCGESDDSVTETNADSSSSTDNTTSSSTDTTLSEPSNLTATGSAGQVILDWTAVSGASSYTVFWDNSTGVSSSSTAITSVSTDNYTHSSLDNGTVYYYKVAGVDSSGTLGTLASEVSAATPLPAPDNLSASGANNTIILTWASVSGATSYTLYWDNVSGIDSTDTTITSITNDNYTHSNMDNGSTYYYKVVAVNSSGRVLYPLLQVRCFLQTYKVLKPTTLIHMQLQVQQ